MTQRAVVHETFSIARTYPATLSRVFGAFASQEAKNIWGDTGDIASADADGTQTEFDFKVGGREHFGFKYQGTTYRYDALYYDIVPCQRIIYSYEMYADGARVSVSVATIEFAGAGDGSALTWTRARRLPGRHRGSRRGAATERGRCRDAQRSRKVPRFTASDLTEAWLYAAGPLPA